jgi:hypothetical protein
MIPVKIFLREPGNHHQIAETQLPAVPRVGEYVIHLRTSCGKCTACSGT